MKVGLEITNQTTMDSSFENINFLEKMFKPIWMGSDQDLKIFRDTLVKNTYINQESLLSSYNISKDRIEQIKQEVNTNVDNYLQSIVDTNNMYELRALLGSTMKELNDRFVDGSLESDYPFKNNSINEAFFNKGNALKGDRAKVEVLDFETISISVSGLSKEAKEELYKVVKDTQIQSMFSAATMDDNYIKVVYSRQGFNEFNNTYFKSKQLNVTSNINMKDSREINSRSLKLFETLAKELPTLTFSKKDKLGNQIALISSNDVLGTSNEFVEDIKNKEQQKIDNVKGFNKTENIEKRGSNPKDTLLSKIRNVDPDNPKETMVVKKDIKDILDIRTTNKEDIANDMLDLEILNIKEQMSKAKEIADEVSVKFIQYIEVGKSFEEAKKLINEFTRGNEYATKLGITYATKSLLEIKNTNDVLSNENIELSNKIKQVEEQITLAIETIEAKDLHIDGLLNDHKESIFALQEEIESKLESIMKLNTLVEELNKENEELDKEVVKLESSNKELESSNEFLGEQLDKEQDKNNTLELTVKNLNINIETLNETINSKLNEILELNNKITSKIEEINSLNKTIEVKDSEYSKLEEYTEQKEKDLELKVKELNSKEEELIQANYKINELNEDYSTLNGKYNESLNIQQSLKESNNGLSESLKVSNEDVTRLTQENNNYFNKNQELENRIKELEKALNEKQTKDVETKLEQHKEERIFENKESNPYKKVDLGSVRSNLGKEGFSDLRKDLNVAADESKVSKFETKVEPEVKKETKVEETIVDEDYEDLSDKIQKNELSKADQMAKMREDLKQHINNKDNNDDKSSNNNHNKHK